MFKRSRPSAVAPLDRLTTETSPDRFWKAAGRGGAACTLAPPAVVRLRNYSRMDQPDFVNKSRARFLAPLQYEAAAVRLYSLRDVGFYGSAALFETQGRIVAESAAHWHPAAADTPEALAASLAAQRPKARIDFEAPPVRLQGPHLLAANLFAANYYHWHFDLLTTPALVAGLRPLEGLKVLVNRRTPAVLDTLSALGVRAEAVVELPPDRAARVDQLVFASCIASELPRTHPRAVEALQKLGAGLIGEPPAAPWRRVLVSRRSSAKRPLANRAELEAAFAAEGFEVLDPGDLDAAAQARLFAEADVLIGEHGANFTNAVHCRPGALVLELFHPTELGWSCLCFLALSECKGLFHRSLVGEGLQGDAWRVDVAAVLAFARDAETRRRAQLRREALPAPEG